jgi:hypothetical protein
VPVLFSLATRNSNGFFISSALVFFLLGFLGRFIEPGHVDGLGFDIQFCNIFFKLKSEISGLVLGDTDTCTMYPLGVSHRVVLVRESGDPPTSTTFCIRKHERSGENQSGESLLDFGCFYFCFIFCIYHELQSFT